MKSYFNNFLPGKDSLTIYQFSCGSNSMQIRFKNFIRGNVKFICTKNDSKDETSESCFETDLFVLEKSKNGLTFKEKSF